MTWTKLSDDWWRHPKLMDVSLAASGLWARAASWCGDQLTDGFVPKSALKLFGGATPKHAEELVAAGLWDATDAGWTFHQWLDHNPSKEAVLTKREAGKKRAAKSYEETKTFTNSSREESAKTERSNTDSSRALHSSRSRPDPGPSQEKEVNEGGQDLDLVAREDCPLPARPASLGISSENHMMDSRKPPDSAVDVRSEVVWLNQLCGEVTSWAGSLLDGDRLERTAGELVRLAFANARDRNIDGRDLLELVMRKWFTPDRMAIKKPWVVMALQDWPETLELIEKEERRRQANAAKQHEVSHAAR